MASAATSKRAGIVVLDENFSWEGVMHLATCQESSKGRRNHESTKRGMKGSPPPSRRVAGKRARLADLAATKHDCPGIWFPRAVYSHGNSNDTNMHEPVLELPIEP